MSNTEATLTEAQVKQAEAEAAQRAWLIEVAEAAEDVEGGVQGTPQAAVVQWIGDEFRAARGKGWTGMHKAFRDSGGKISAGRFKRLYNGLLKMAAEAADAAAAEDVDDEGEAE